MAIDEMPKVGVVVNLPGVPNMQFNNAKLLARKNCFVHNKNRLPAGLTTAIESARNEPFFSLLSWVNAFVRWKHWQPVGQKPGPNVIGKYYDYMNIPMLE